jgi:hypothetical protein
MASRHPSLDAAILVFAVFVCNASRGQAVGQDRVARHNRISTLFRRARAFRNAVTEILQIPA